MTWLHPQCLQLVHLELGVRESLDDPTIYPAVALLQSFLDMVVYDVVREPIAVINALLDYFTNLWTLLNFVFQDLLH